MVEAADATNRGSVMATRFGLVQTASIVGIAVGGLITKEYGPFAAYGVLGIGLVLLAMYAIAAGRSLTNPLHGARYEEAVNRANGGAVSRHIDDAARAGDGNSQVDEDLAGRKADLQQAKT